MRLRPNAQKDASREHDKPMRKIKSRLNIRPLSAVLMALSSSTKVRIRLLRRSYTTERGLFTLRPVRFLI